MIHNKAFASAESPAQSGMSFKFKLHHSPDCLSNLKTPNRNQDPCATDSCVCDVAQVQHRLVTLEFEIQEANNVVTLAQAKDWVIGKAMKRASYRTAGAAVLLKMGASTVYKYLNSRDARDKAAAREV